MVSILRRSLPRHDMRILVDSLQLNNKVDVTVEEKQHFLLTSLKDLLGFHLLYASGTSPPAATLPRFIDQLRFRPCFDTAVKTERTVKFEIERLHDHLGEVMQGKRSRGRNNPIGPTPHSSLFIAEDDLEIEYLLAFPVVLHIDEVPNCLEDRQEFTELLLLDGWSCTALVRISDGQNQKGPLVFGTTQQLT